MLKKYIFLFSQLIFFSIVENIPNGFAQKTIPNNTVAIDANIPKNYVRLLNTFIMKSGIAPTNAARIHA